MSTIWNLNDVEELAAQQMLHSVPFTKPLTMREWLELDAWCDENLGKNNWYIGANTFYAKNVDYIIMFLLRWL